MMASDTSTRGMRRWWSAAGACGVCGVWSAGGSGVPWVEVQAAVNPVMEA